MPSVTIFLNGTVSGTRRCSRSSVAVIPSGRDGSQNSMELLGGPLTTLMSFTAKSMP